jgi:hypothetical protein
MLYKLLELLTDPKMAQFQQKIRKTKGKILQDFKIINKMHFHIFARFKEKA